MYVIDKATHDGSTLRVLGWCFKPGIAVLKVFAQTEDGRLEIPGYGLESADVAQYHGSDAENARFEFSIPADLPKCTIDFIFEDESTSRIQIDLTESRARIEPLVHRIHNEVYTGKFFLNTSAAIQSVHFLAQTDDPEKRSAPITFSEAIEEERRILRIKTSVPESWEIQELGILVETEGEQLSLASIANIARSHDESHQICARFFEYLDSSSTPLRVIEIGARARSGIVRKHQFGSQNDYIGFDIMAGPNVDVVGDIHSLSRSFEPNSIDAMAGFSVIEHIAMPWKAAIEINKVLKRGGRCMFHTHQTWPVHEAPYDFWRFSTDSWRAIFNKSSGFRILESACGEAATIHPLIQHSKPNSTEGPCGYTSSSVLVEKIADTKLTWDVDMDDIHLDEYPA